MSSESGGGHQTPSGCVVLNNTFVNCQYNMGIGLNYSSYPRTNTIANNIITGSVNQLFKFGSTQSSSENNNTYSANMAYPTGTAVLGTNLTSPKVTVTNPKLNFSTMNGYNMFRLDPTSPAINAATGSYSYITADFFGGARSTSDIGAEEYGAGTVKMPLTTANVGPANAPL